MIFPAFCFLKNIMTLRIIFVLCIHSLFNVSFYSFLYIIHIFISLLFWLHTNKIVSFLILHRDISTEAGIALIHLIYWFGLDLAFKSSMFTCPNVYLCVHKTEYILLFLLMIFSGIQSFVFFKVRWFNACCALSSSSLEGISAPWPGLTRGPSLVPWSCFGTKPFGLILSPRDSRHIGPTPMIRRSRESLSQR